MFSKSCISVSEVILAYIWLGYKDNIQIGWNERLDPQKKTLLKSFQQNSENFTIEFWGKEVGGGKSAGFELVNIDNHNLNL